MIHTVFLLKRWRIRPEIMPCLLVAAALCAATAQEPDMSEKRLSQQDLEVVLELAPGDGNPRNSEGDFIGLNDGRLLFIYTRFTGGTSDHAAASLVSRYSTDGGATWSAEDIEVVPNEGAMNVMSVSLLRLRNGAIALFYLRKNSEDDCRPVMRVSTDESATWGPPTECIEAPVGYYVVNNDRVVQLRDGRLVIPAALHALKGEPFSQRGSVVCYLSNDRGRSWRRSKTMLQAPADMRTGFQEPGVIELSSGALLMLLRNDSGVFYRSESRDGGDTWTAPVPTDLRTPVSPASFKRVPGTDAIMLLWNDHQNISEDLAGKRTPLTLALSWDDGLSWQDRVRLEDHPHGWYCYTALTFTDTHALLAYCAGDTRNISGLALTRIARLPLDRVRVRPVDPGNTERAQ